MKYLVEVNGRECGPYTFFQLRNMWSSGSLTLDTLWKLHEDPAADWSRMENMLPEGTILLQAAASGDNVDFWVARLLLDCGCCNCLA
jgi:hypothetical protein